MKIYLINPKYNTPTYFGSEVLNEMELSPITWIADLALPTVAGLIPSDVEVELCDENLTDIDFNKEAIIFITGKNEQIPRMREIAQEFKARGQWIVIGGVAATLNPELLRDVADILVKGELESIADELIEDLKAWDWKYTYEGQHTCFVNSKVPRWDLYPCEYALMGSIQTSRGCNFNCDFCQVAVYAGKQRHKPIDKVIDELEVLYENGFRYIFICDDNFTADKEHARKLLQGIIKWQQWNSEPVFFLTQVSLDVTKDTELVSLMAEAGIISVFVGIETNNKEALISANKNHNVVLDEATACKTFLESGIVPMSGIIFGFDSDTPYRGLELLNFLQNVPIPIYTVWALLAPKGTQLYQRLLRETRVEDRQIMMAPWDSNVIPAKMSVSDFRDTTKLIIESLYRSDNFHQRLKKTFDILKPSPRLKDIKNKNLTTQTAIAILRRLQHIDYELYTKVIKMLMDNVDLSPYLLSIMMLYIQIDYMINNVKEL